LIFDGTPDLPVVVPGNSLTQYLGVMGVLEELSRLGITHVGRTTTKRRGG
jgi:hypothetical protein